MNNNSLSDRINNLSTSQTLAMAALARELKAQGKDIISLSLGEPDFNTPDFIKEAAKKAIDENYSTYSPVDGYQELKEAICRKFKRDNNLEYKPANIVVSTGAKQSLYNIAQVMLNDGDEVILPAPYWVSYFEIVKMAGGIPVEVPTSVESDFKITPQQLEAAITPKTKMICLCNPLNPTGKVFTRVELIHLAEIAERHDLAILSDEIWSDIVFKPFQFTSLASIDQSIQNRTVTITGFSKSYGLAGLRIGAILTSNETYFKKIYSTSRHESTVHGSNVIGQIAAKTALNECRWWLINFIIHLQKMRDLCVSELNSINGFNCIAPQGCYVAFANITKTGMSSEAMHNYLLEEAKVAVVPGVKKWFGEGANGYIRLSFATSEQILTEALSRIKNSIK